MHLFVLLRLKEFFSAAVCVTHRIDFVLTVSCCNIKVRIWERVHGGHVKMRRISWLEEREREREREMRDEVLLIMAIASCLKS